MKTKPKLKWWNNGWLWLAVLLISYATLFIVGMITVDFAKNPVFEDRKLSDWTDDLLENDPLIWGAHDEAVEVLGRHRKQIKPVLMGWLDSRDTVPQTVYLATLGFFERFGSNPPDDLGASGNQLRAVKAFRALGARDPEVIAALQRNLTHYKSRTSGKTGRSRLYDIAESALQRSAWK